MKRAVVTGASGFIGQRLVQELCQAGVQVTAVDRNEADLPCHFVRGDIGESRLLDQLLSVDTVVFHLAAHTSVSGSVAEPEYDFRVNVASFLEVLESIRRTGAALIFPSSAAVFDANQPLPHAESGVKRPVSPYGAAKLACEAYCAAYHDCYQLNIKVARLFNVYGPGMTRFAIYDFYRKIRHSPHRLEILGDGNQVRDYLYIDDVVAGLCLIASRGLAGQEYNLASGQPTRLLDLARHVAAAMGHADIQITACGHSFPGDVAQWYADIRKVRDLGFEPTVELTDGIRRTVEFLDNTVRHSERRAV